MQYAKSKRSNVASDLVNEDELNKVQVETGAQKRDQLAFLNRKVKQFEERVAREEQLIRNKEGGAGVETNFEQQTQVNDQYIKAIEAKLKILN